MTPQEALAAAIGNHGHDDTSEALPGCAPTILAALTEAGMSVVPTAEELDVDRLARARYALLDDIGSALSQKLAQGYPFEPYDRVHVAKVVTRVLDEARERVRLAAGPAVALAEAQ